MRLFDASMITTNSSGVKVLLGVGDALDQPSGRDYNTVHQCRRAYCPAQKLVKEIPVGTSRENRRIARVTSSRSPGTRLEGATPSPQAEGDMLIGILETLSRSRHMNEYLEQLVEHVRNYAGCCCIGIRLLDDDGNIPYTSYTGFSRDFSDGSNSVSEFIVRVMRKV